MQNSNGLSASKKRILFVSHKKARCGVYEFGKSITDVLEHSRRYQFVRVECSSLAELQAAIAGNRPAAIIYNYYPTVLPWLATRIVPRLYRNNIAAIQIPQIGIIHEITQHVADTAINYKKKYLPFASRNLINLLFDYYIAADPTLLLFNPFVYKTGRLVPSYAKTFKPPSETIIGSIGFATPGKGFEKIVRLVQQEFNEAIIRFNIPSADFGDKEGSNARAVTEICRAQINKPGIQLLITHDFLDKEDMLDFLAQNTINVFLYENGCNRGLSSAIDNAMAVRRPIAVSDDGMFRHLFDVEPSVCVTRNSLKTIIRNGFNPLLAHYNEWNSRNLLWEYERILDSIFLKRMNPASTKKKTKEIVKSKLKRAFFKPDIEFTWLPNSEKVVEDDLRVDRSIHYRPIQIPDGDSLNRILDNTARELYSPAIAKLTELVPKAMSKKIAEANVQQAFVFDTVYRHLSRYESPKLLCVGSYGDTASMGLLKMGYMVEEIDPMLNYSLQEFFTKPTTLKNSYEIIFSTSVIEHDPDDESFIKCISELLAPGGMAVITCDYKEGWQPSEPKPKGNARFYTRQDLKNRLLPIMSNCQLVDEPQWDCPKPDFIYLGKYQYAFATFVVLKNA